MLSFAPRRPLPLDPGETCRGLAFDGDRSVLTIPGACRVTVLDGDLQPVEEVRTGRPYTALCRDSLRDCFWACSDRDRGTLFRLDRGFQEVGRLVPRWEGRRPGPITGVSFCRERDLLAVSCGGRLLEVDPESGAARLLWEERGNGLILSVAYSFPYLLFSVLREGAARFILTACDGTELRSEPAPDLSMATGFLFLPGSRELRLLAGGCGGAPALCSARLEGGLAALLEPWGEDAPPAACADLLASAALLEAALAHILNAEGEKLQALLRRPVPLSEVEAAARSVRRTLRAVIQLETALFDKLRTMPGLCGEEKAEETAPEGDGEGGAGPPGGAETVSDGAVPDS